MMTNKKMRGLLSALGVCLFLAICLIGVAGCGLFSNNEYMRYDDSEYAVGGTSLSQNVELIKIDWVDGDITVNVSDSAYYVSFYEQSNADNLQDSDVTLRYKVYGNQLLIKFAKSRASLKGNVKKTLTVTLPAQNVDQLSIANIAGDVSVRGSNITAVTGTEIDVETVSGNVSFSTLNVNKVEVETVSGAVSFSSCVVATEIDIESVSGDVEFWFGPQKDFVCTFNTVSGRVENYIEATKNGNTYTYGDGAKVAIRVDTVSGKLKLVLNPVYA